MSKKNPLSKVIKMNSELLRVIHSSAPVAGLTHGFYRYPARFSPLFARAAIKAFTKPGDLVLDPFMGGGTTLVEARASGRRAIGVDTNSLAVFVSKVKTTPLSETDLSKVKFWAADLTDELNLRNPSMRAAGWEEDGYHRNINSKTTWPLRKTLGLALTHVGELSNERQREFARCVLLKTGQWALDCRTRIPSVQQFRQQLLAFLDNMVVGAREYADAVKNAHRLYRLDESFRTLCLHRSAVGIEEDTRLFKSAPALILTSPPYPGVHVVYHRWQVRGRKETPAPYWIANSLDGNGASFYTFGDRKQAGLTTYYEQARAAFGSLAQVASDKTLVVQMVAFSDPSWQFPKYLSVMERAGFREIKPRYPSNSSDGRIWRAVPNRKWYANRQAALASSKEVVLFHRLK